MARFNADDWERIDYRLMQNGAVTLYRNPQFLEDDIGMLKKLDYRTHEFDCSSAVAFRQSVSTIFDFAGNFGYADWGGNLDALNDAFRELEFSESAGLTFVLQPYGSIINEDRELADAFIDMVEYHSRNHLLFGNRLMALVQVDDPRIVFEDLGVRSAMWNNREWLDKNRGL